MNIWDQVCEQKLECRPWIRPEFCVGEQGGKSRVVKALCYSLQSPPKRSTNYIKLYVPCEKSGDHYRWYWQSLCRLMQGVAQLDRLESCHSLLFAAGSGDGKRRGGKLLHSSKRKWWWFALGVGGGKNCAESTRFAGGADQTKQLIG